ncbi:putative peptidoglycan glycosyltransferase FtsW [bioreactor metagenome]|uniref:Putative peptidoglycan glycosyltransferase FtsW n=1 Tax=bioreactor metagenome TaxID=1076179 RepID=A0A645IRN5_9ZZZZ
MGLCVIAFYLVFILRGAKIALNAPNRFLMLLAFGCTTLITLQSFIIIGGVIKLIPLTGVTLPFVSAGGSSMITSMVLLGILEAISIAGGEAADKEKQEELEHERLERETLDLEQEVPER